MDSEIVPRKAGGHIVSIEPGIVVDIPAIEVDFSILSIEELLGESIVDLSWSIVHATRSDPSGSEIDSCPIC
jgi:hypothetical protein